MYIDVLIITCAHSLIHTCSLSFTLSPIFTLSLLHSHTHTHTRCSLFYSFTHSQADYHRLTDIIKKRGQKPKPPPPPPPQAVMDPTLPRPNRLAPHPTLTRDPTLNDPAAFQLSSVAGQEFSDVSA